MAILLLVVATIYLFILFRGGTEGFSTRQDKVAAIYNWFRDKKSPNYADYKQDLRGGSNIVEYEDVLELAKNRNFTAEDIDNVV